MTEWSRVSRLAAGSSFSGSPAPVPITWWVWSLVRSTTRSTRPVSPTRSRSRMARSMKAWAWYSAEWALVKVSRMARRGSPGSGSGTW